MSIKQARFLIIFPSKLKFTSLQCLFSAIQAFGIAIAYERDMKEWKIGWNMGLLAVLYCVSIKAMFSNHYSCFDLEKLIFLKNVNVVCICCTNEITP